ncbi:unnamed protein product [Clavelina lepadiformis]|uniref:Uncharacterized protein n=1 Tax=Clavelina lepadiformis TaxID=159417 RepID=A0ABP0FWB3_CLALP
MVLRSNINILTLPGKVPFFSTVTFPYLYTGAPERKVKGVYAAYDLRITLKQVLGKYIPQ